MDVKVNGRTVTATIHLDEGRPASTRKSTILFTTNGYVPIEDGMRISINIIAPNDNDNDARQKKNGGRAGVDAGGNDIADEDLEKKNSLCPQRGS